MKEFHSKWETWGDRNFQTPYRPTDKTDERVAATDPFDLRTDKTDESPGSEHRRGGDCKPTEPTKGGDDGLSVIAHLDRQRGRTLDHPWRDRLVSAPECEGVLIWTDGYRAAVSPSPNMAWLVDLADVRLAAVTTEG